jgi:hypothetical protein
MTGMQIFYTLMVVASVAAAAYSLFATRATTEQKKLILVFWLVAPPAYFFLEYYFRQPYVDVTELARLKDMQDRAAQIWAGVSAALAAIYFKS